MKMGHRFVLGSPFCSDDLSDPCGVTLAMMGKSRTPFGQLRVCTASLVPKKNGSHTIRHFPVYQTPLYCPQAFEFNARKRLMTVMEYSHL
jgi:hypothetical protein